MLPTPFVFIQSTIARLEHIQCTSSHTPFQLMDRMLVRSNFNNWPFTNLTLHIISTSAVLLFVSFLKRDRNKRQVTEDVIKDTKAFDHTTNVKYITGKNYLDFSRIKKTRTVLNCLGLLKTFGIKRSCNWDINMLIIFLILL